MTIKTARFGNVEATAEDIISFPDGILGFAASQSFVILNHGQGAFRWLQSVDEPSLAFLVTDPACYFPDYAPAISEEAAESLGLKEQSPMLVYTIVTIPRGKPQQMTLNLAGPIVINAATRKGRQFVIDDEAYSIRQRVFEATEAPPEQKDDTNPTLEHRSEAAA